MLARNSLRNRLLLTTMVAGAVALSIAGTIFLVYEKHELREELGVQVDTLAHLVGRGAWHALNTDDPEPAQDLLESLSTRPEVIAATIDDADGRRLGEYRRGTDAAGVTFPDRFTGVRFDGERFIVGHAVEGPSGEHLGRVYLAADTRQIDAHLLREAGVAMIVVIPAFLVAFLLTARAQRRIVRPIEALVRDAVDRVPDADAATWDGRSLTGAHDEAGVLSASFARLRDEVRDRELGQVRTAEYFRSLIENTGDLVLVLEADGTLRYAGPAFLRDYGYARDDVLGRPLFDFVHDDDRDALSAVLARATRSHRGLSSGEIRLRMRGGGARVVECLARNDLDDPVVGGIVINGRDVTERTATERALHASERRYREVVEHAADAFFVHDDSGRFLDVNQEACESLGYSRDELLSMRVEDVELNIPSEDVPGVWADMVPGVPVTIQGRHRRKDGSEFPVEVRVGLLRADGERRMVALARDVSERARVQAELQRAKEAAEAGHRTKSLFLANVSHEIRTPLTAILGMAELLRADPDAPDREHGVEVIRASCDALLSVIDGILDLSRAEAGSLTLECVDFDVHGLVEGVLDMLATTAHRKGLELVAPVAPDVPQRLRGDPDRLRQVLSNLVGNAVKFTERGHVSLEVSMDREPGAGDRVRFCVRDTGPGLSAVERERLFEPFVRGDDLPGRRQAGAGLGLPIAHFLVRRMGGELQVDDGDGGSTFWFSVALEAATVPATDTRDGRPEVDGVRVLVADRDAAMRDALCAQLAQHGVRARGAASLVDAIAVLHAAAEEDDPFRIALIDWRLEGSPGTTLARIVATDERLSSTRPVIMTPLGLQLAPAMRALMADYPHVSKPLRQSRLGDTIAELLSETHEHETAPVEVGATAAGTPRVLVVEDDAVNREALTLLMRCLACEVDAVGDGEAAVAAVTGARYDLVLMDWRMPGISGLEATARIRELEGAERHTRIVAVTASGAPDEREQCLAAGMDDFLRKPVSLDQLDRALAAATGGSGDPQPQPRHVVPIPTRAMRELHDLFTRHAGETLEQMHAALVGRDADTVARLAHGLCGASRQLDADAIAEAARALETHCRSHGFEHAAPLLERLWRKFDEFTDAADALRSPTHSGDAAARASAAAERRERRD